MKHSLRLFGASFYFSLLDLLRVPINFLIVTFAPAIILYATGSLESDSNTLPVLAAYSTFGVMNSCVMQVAAMVSQDRGLPWEAYLRSLPGSWTARLWGKACATTVTSYLSVIPVFAIVVLDRGFTALSSSWMVLPATLMIVPLSVSFGIILGFIGPPRLTATVASLVFITLALIGRMFGGDIEGWRAYLPTGLARQFVSLVSKQFHLPWPETLTLGIETLIFMVCGAFLINKLGNRSTT